MKKRSVTTALLLIGAGMLPAALPAQQRIEQAIERAERMNDVHVNVIVNRDEQTQAVEQTIRSVNIANNRALVAEFRAAFDQEQANAYQASENTDNGLPQRRLRFRAGEREISCNLRVESDSKATVTYIDGVSRFPELNLTVPNFTLPQMPDLPELNSLDTAALRRKMEEFGRNMERWGEQYGRQMEQWSREYGPKLEEYMKQMEPQMEEFRRRMEAWGQEYGRKFGEQNREEQ